MYHIDRGAWAEINLDAVAHNVQIAKSNLDPHTKLCAVVKADAYGHGAVAVAREAEKNGADFLAVALLQEGLELREAGIRLPILVLGSLQPGAANVVVQFDISHAVFDEERLYALNEAAVKLNKKARIHIAIDTGMHRIGVHVRDAGEFAAKAAALPGIEIEGVFSHFATADADDKAYAAHQVCLDIQNEVASMAKPGAVCEDLYNTAIDMVTKAGFAENFMGISQQARFIGHGIGLEINEMPVIAPRMKQELEPGMVFALEPKIVLPGVGPVGIENSWAVTSEGVEKLTICNEEIIEL